jgi:hypothetical protein
MFQVCVAFLLASLLTLTHAPVAQAAAWRSDATTSQFKSWYPQYGFVFERALHENCADQYAAYLTAIKNDSTIDWYGGGDKPSALTQPVIQCILNQTTDYIKSAMSSAQVLLGLTPTILAVLGSSTEELSLLSVIARRPFLALLLSLASPSVFVSRAFEYNDPVSMLQDRPGRLKQPNPRGWMRMVIVVLEYACAITAMGNVAVLNWQLGVGTVCGIWPDNVIAPMLWGVLVVLVHIVGAFIMRLQARRTTVEYPGAISKDGPVGVKDWLKSSPDRIWTLTQTEFKPSASQEDIYITAFPERRWFVVLSWMLSTCVIVHVIFGTLVLSSLYFIGPRDALSVVGRYMSSVLVCRIICMYEISGLREQCKQIVLTYEKPNEKGSYDFEGAGFPHQARTMGDRVSVVSDWIDQNLMDKTQE